MRKALLVVISAVILMGCGCAFNTIKKCPDLKQLQAKIDKVRKRLENREFGHVIVGRVVLEGDGNVLDVKSQMEILYKGYFAGPIRTLGRPVGFRMHQYAPYDLQMEIENMQYDKERDLYDVGTIYMKPMEQEQLAELKAQVILEEGGNLSQASLQLSVRNGPVNTPSNGTEPRPYWPDPIKIPVQADGLVQASGFSPIEYYCQVTAPEYLKKVFNINFEERQVLDLGKITMEKPKQINLAYIVSKEPPFDIHELKTATFPAGTRWKAVDDIYGWDLEFKQDKGSVIATYSYAPCYLWNLGDGQIEQYVNIQAQQPKLRLERNHRVRNNNVYLLHQKSWKRWVLFKISIE